MMTTQLNTPRRRFLTTLLSAAGTGVAAPLAMNLALMSEASAQTAGNYRAIVCLFMYGANDHYNTVIPFDAAGYAQYNNARASIARPLADLVEIATADSLGGRRFALPKELEGLAKLYNDGDAAVLANVGPLVQPTTLAEFKARSVKLPPQLFSHNDQQSFWQSSAPEGAASGWGGRMADLLMAGNGNAQFSTMGVGVRDVLLVGRQVAPYAVTPTGPVPTSAVTDAARRFGATEAEMRTLTSGDRRHLLEKQLAIVNGRSQAAYTTVQQVFQPAAPVVFPDTALGKQLAGVAKLIAGRGSLGATRQVFMVGIGGFDTHDFQLRDQPVLHTQINNAVVAFQAAMKALGVQDNVTLFTASDFGRTLTSNGDGSDHGWGSHHFMVGGAVKGKRVYGAMPEYRTGHDWDTGSGRLLPTTSVDQYAATLGKWLGLSDSQLLDVLPNLANYNASTRNIGFMEA